MCLCAVFNQAGNTLVCVCDVDSGRLCPRLAAALATAAAGVLLLLLPSAEREGGREGGDAGGRALLCVWQPPPGADLTAAVTLS